MLTKEALECIDMYNSFNVNIDIEEITYTRPKPPKNASEIINFGLPKEKRKFPFIDYEELLKKQHTDPDFPDFFKREWDRRKHGLYFYNGDQLEYVTGDHYMFLQYWVVDNDTVDEDGYAILKSQQPDFRDMNRDMFYFFDHCKKDPNCYGMLFIGRRRTAKTEMALSCGYWDSTSGERRKFYIQSKTGSDAEKCFNRLITSWKKLPYYWKPTDKGQSDVKEKLEFKRPKKTNTKTKQKDYGKELNSEIGIGSSVDTGLDGESATFILNDEIGKTEKRVANPKNRWYVNQKCLVRGSTIIGKAILTTTVEEVDSDNIQDLISLWEASNPNKKNAIGRTTSGLYRLFLPADLGFTGVYPDGTPMVDEWGYSNRELSRKFILADREGKLGRDLVDEKRRNPLSIDEALYVNNQNAVFSVERLRSQYSYNEKNAIAKNIRRGNLFWVNGIKWGTVDWRDDNNGRWERYIEPHIEERNRFTTVSLSKKPTQSFYVTGCDPVDHSGVRGRGSMAVAYTIAKPNVRTAITTKTPAMRYSFRHPDANMFYEDMIMQCLYYSSPFLAENQKYGVLNAFKDKGFDGFVMRDPLEKDYKTKMKNKGFNTTSKDNNEAMITLMQSYIMENVGYSPETESYGDFPYNDLISDLQNFDPHDRTKNDDSMAFMVTLVGASAQVSDFTQQKNYATFLPKPVRGRY